MRPKTECGHVEETQGWNEASTPNASTTSSFCQLVTLLVPPTS